MSDTNTNNRLLSMLQDMYPAYHPIIAMAKLAHESGTDEQIVFNCHKEIARYIEPQLKAVEHRGSIKADFGILRVIQTEDTMQLPNPDSDTTDDSDSEHTTH